MGEIKINRLETTKKIGPMINEYWDKLRRAPGRAKKRPGVRGPFCG